MMILNISKTKSSPDKSGELWIFWKLF